MKNRTPFCKLLFLLAVSLLVTMPVTGCQAHPVDAPIENAPALDEEITPAGPVSNAVDLPEDVVPVDDTDPASSTQKLPDITIDIDLTVLVGSYSTLDGDKWLAIEWEESDDSWLWLFFGGFDASGEYASEWSACVNCDEISGNRIHTPVGVLDTSDSVVTDIEMVYIPDMPGIPAYDMETVYLYDGTDTYIFYRDIDSLRYEDYFAGPEDLPDAYDAPDQISTPADGTITYFRFMTEVGQYVAQNGDYVLINAWTWTNNEVAQYGVSGNPVSWHTNRALPPVSIEVERCVVLPKYFSISETTYQSCSEDVLQMGFDKAEIATYSNMSW